MSVYDYRFGTSAASPCFQQRDQSYHLPTTTNLTCPRRCGRVMPTDKRLVWDLSDS